jgi:hypothetical protein
MKLARSVSSAVLVGGLILSGALAKAQGVGGIPFAQIDINGDGFLDAAELMAAFDAAGLSVLGWDLSGDGLVTREELRATRRRSHDDTSVAQGTARPSEDTQAQGTRSNPEGGADAASGRGAVPDADPGDANNGHGNDPDGNDMSNPGQGQGNNGNGPAGNGPGNSNAGGQGKANGGRD